MTDKTQTLSVGTGKGGQARFCRLLVPTALQSEQSQGNRRYQHYLALALTAA